MKKAFGLAKYQGDYKGLHTAIVKGTNYDHALPKDKHIRTIFQSLSPSKPRTEVIYCINGLARRVNHTNNWAVALKSLIIIHRAMRELDNTVWEEFVHYSKGRDYFIDVSNFDDTSIPNALDYSSWIRNYGLYLEERLRCYTVFNHDVATYTPKHSQKLDTEDLLKQLPPLQILLSRLLDCKPGGAAACNRLIQYALSIVAGESVKLYVAITVRVVELLDKFFEMNRNDAVSALKIYQKSGSQAEKLSELFETCRGLEFGRGQKFITIKQPPASFMTTMEEYINDTPCTLLLEHNVDAENKGATGNEDATCLGDLLTTDDDAEKSDPSPENNEATAPSQAADLMGLYDLLTGASEFEENSLALAIVPPTEKSIDSNNDEKGASPVTTGWEVALFTEEASAESSSIENAVDTAAESKEITIFEKQSGELDVSKLDSLYNEAMNGGGSGYNIGQVNENANANANPFDFQASQYNNMAVAQPNIQSGFYGSPNMASQIPVAMTYQDYYVMHHQQQEPFMNNNNNMMMIQKTTNPFDEPNVVLPPASAVPATTPNSDYLTHV